MDLNWSAKIKGLPSFHRIEIDECTRDSMTYIFLFPFFSFFFWKGNVYYFLLRIYVLPEESHPSRVWNKIRFNDRSFLVDKELVILEII